MSTDCQSPLVDVPGQVPPTPTEAMPQAPAFSVNLDRWLGPESSDDDPVRFNSAL